MLRRIAVLLLTLVATLACAATARADLLTIMAQDFVDDQRLDPCRYSEQQLRTLKDLIPNDLNAYAADFVAAVDDALARRAEGACNTGAATSPAPSSGAAAPPAGAVPTPPPPAAGAPADTPGAVAAPGQTAPAQPPPTPAAQPAPVVEIAVRDAIGIAARAEDPATAAPFPLLALAILTGLLGLAGLAVGLVRWRAWEPAWAIRLRHATGEAGWRASSTWAEFTDFVRFGR